MSSMPPSRKRYHSGTEAAGYYFVVEEELCNQQTPYQHLEVVETKDFGRVMLLDKEIMTTEWDGFVYPEMIIHPACMSHADPRSLLIVGGGDGGAATEAARYKSLEAITVCEIDENVVQAGKKFFPDLARGFDDPRTTLHCEDANEWISGQEANFDVIAVDGTDPVGPGVVLFEEAFYQRAQRALKPGGIYVQQVESPFYSLREGSLIFDLRFEEIVARARRVFEQVHVYCTVVPTYLGSLWAFLFAGDADLSIEPNEGRWEALSGRTRFYRPEIHRAAFVLPPFVKELIRGT